MKTLHKLVLKTFLGPFVITFFVALFVLVMQFLWKYVDDLVGKGLEVSTIAQLLIYMSATFIPLALPLAVLLSSIMSFGNLGEHFELVAIKSAGIPLRRAMAPLIVLMVFLCVSAFFISNNLIPKANLEAMSLLYDVRNKKPTFDLKEGVFNNSLEGYSIRIGSKAKESNKVSDIIIYDHREGRGNVKVITSRKGEIKFSQDNNFLFFELSDGAVYEEVKPSRGNTGSFPHSVMYFQTQQIVIDIRDLKFSRTDKNLFKDNYQMLNIKELECYIDTLKLEHKDKGKELRTFMMPYFHLNDSLNKKFTPQKVDFTQIQFINNFDKDLRKQISGNALNNARSVKSIIGYQRDDIESHQKEINKYKIEWHRKFTLSFACMVLFFIGAPFGAIIRKGGLGMPLVVSVFLFIIFHIITITGEKMVKENAAQPILGMWAATLILMPVGIYLTRKATTDSDLFDVEAYKKPFRALIQFVQQMHANKSKRWLLYVCIAILTVALLVIFYLLALKK